VLALIDGLPEEPDPTGGAFGFNAYPVGAVTSKNSLSRSEVLLKARELHFEHVLELLPDGSVVSHAIEP
jgi:hypothetical protein